MRFYLHFVALSFSTLYNAAGVRFFTSLPPSRHSYATPIPACCRSDAWKSWRLWPSLNRDGISADSQCRDVRLVRVVVDQRVFDKSVRREKNNALTRPSFHIVE